MAKPLQKERENRSADKKDLNFHPFTITPETAHTSILLLESKEPEILCQTLRAITKFAAQDIQNRYILFNLNAIKYIILHVEHPELNIRRFSLKALAQMCQLPKGPEQVLQDPQNLRKIAFSLAKIEDLFVLEFASLVLSELTKEPVGCDQLISANILSSLFNRMKNSLDPDVQKNCLQIKVTTDYKNFYMMLLAATEPFMGESDSHLAAFFMNCGDSITFTTLSNVLNDPICASEVTKNPQFNWAALLALTQSKYLAIQHAALHTVEQLIARYKDQNIQKSFKASTGITDLCDILESYEFRDVHTQVLGVMKTFVETEDNADHVYKAGCINRLLAYLDMALPAMKSHCIAVLTKMSFTAAGRIALYETGTDLVFCQNLLGSNMDLLADAAMGVANMTKLMHSAVRMADTNIIDALCAILGDEAAAWFDVRINSLLAMCELCHIIPKAAFAMVEPKNFVAIRNINRKPKDSPIEAQRLAMNCFINLLNYQISMKAMLNSEFMGELLAVMQRIDIQLKIKTATVITGLMVEEMAKTFFTSKKGEEVVSENLYIEHIGLRTALCILISASVTDEGADIYLALDTIQYMLENKQARYVVNAWEPALEEILRHHCSAKFAYYGKLDINDFTHEGFYVLKRLGGSFPTMQRLLEARGPHAAPVYVALFYPPAVEPRVSDIRTPHGRQSASSVRLSVTGRLRFPPVPDDVSLREYMTRLKIWFGDPYREKCAEVSSSLKQRAQLLGEFVAEQMSGLTQERDCSLPCVELHLADLMRELNSQIIGLGYVKCGGALERAVLYKLLADRIGLPCSLHRATSAHAWVEVAVPDLDPEEDPDTEQKYPAGLLRANYVVDLMGCPGRLLPRGSREAQTVCGPTCAPLYVARAPPTVCKCPHSKVTCRD